MYIFITSILSINCIALHISGKVNFTLKSEKYHFATMLVPKDQQPPPPKHHIDIKCGNLSMDVTPKILF